jgi:hypothetical protein
MADLTLAFLQKWGNAILLFASMGFDVGFARNGFHYGMAAVSTPPKNKMDTVVDGG